VSGGPIVSGGSRPDTANTPWGPQTALAITNFPISGEPVPAEVIRALAEIKSAAVLVNLRHALVPYRTAMAIAAASDELVDELERGESLDQFPVDVFQTGSGTSTNMNVNEVIAKRASLRLGADVHPNDQVNASQSSNDTFPTALRIAAARLVVHDLVPSLSALAASLRELAVRHRTTVKTGRTHLMDAVPMTFGQEAAGWARAVELGIERLEAALPRVLELPIGGTAVGTGLNAPVGFGASVAGLLRRRTGLAVREATDHMEAQSAHDAIVELSGVTKVVALSLHKIAGDIRLLGSGPVGGLAEVRVPALQAGSSIMPGKVNPVIAEAVQQVVAQVVGNDATITFAATMSTLQLNTAAPVIARSIVSSVSLLARAAEALDRQCIRGLEVDADRMRSIALRSPALVTALAPHLGYEAAADLVHRAVTEGRSLSEVALDAGVPAGLVAASTDLLRLAGVEDDPN